MKYTGLETAIKDFNSWQGHAIIMADFTTGKVWTDIFINDHDWRDYPMKTIIPVHSKDGFYQMDDTVSRKRLTQILKAYSKYDWEHLPDTKRFEAMISAWNRVQPPARDWYR